MSPLNAFASQLAEKFDTQTEQAEKTGMTGSNGATVYTGQSKNDPPLRPPRVTNCRRNQMLYSENCG